MADTQTSTVGRYLAARLEQIGLKHYFAVPGDYNLVLLDELLSNDNLQMISCCNELNAGYAADGYARATNGASAVCVTYSVGGLSLINAVAGAYAEDLPVIAISGGTNTNSEAEHELLHHTLGKIDYGYMREMFARVTAESVQITNVLDAPTQIDHAISTALRLRKPVYLEVAANIANAPVSMPHAMALTPGWKSDPQSLAAAVEHAAKLLNAAAKPVLVAGVQLRSGGAEAAFGDVARNCGYGVAAMPNAKGFFDETHPQYMGIFWGSVGSPGCGQIVSSADIGLWAGTTFTDYSTVGHSALINPAKMILVRPHSVVMPGRTYNDVTLSEFLQALAPKLQTNDASLSAFRRIADEKQAPDLGRPDDPLTTRAMFSRIQQMLDADSAVIAETGDSWFNGMQLDLPQGSRFEIQMQYGSIGWSVGATLGYALGNRDRRVVALIGDGSFQLTAQEVSTMIRYGVRPIMFLINNGGYTIEVEIHDGPYNTIKNWDYAGLMAVFNAQDGNGLGLKATTPGELDAAIDKATGHDGPVLIEVTIGRDDCSKNLLEWGGYVARNNSRPPRTI
ncbi:MAG: thiamine pyrophosphate-binding protein [Alphaproteobacteria bacterium]|nr:thiamine pyrophosphate-binding protein [Alphaproteobacteria bacterium]